MNAKNAIMSQYHASLDMLEQAIVACPDTLWDDRGYKNVFWRVAYHTLCYTHLYLQDSEQGFVPWVRRRDEREPLSRTLRDLEEKLGIVEPYTREEILEYLAFCRQQVEDRVAIMALDAPSGFHWLPFDKLELQFYNIRHIQQHTGELYERSGTAGCGELDWVAMKNR